MPAIKITRHVIPGLDFFERFLLPGRPHYTVLYKYRHIKKFDQWRQVDQP